MQLVSADVEQQVESVGLKVSSQQTVSSEMYLSRKSQHRTNHQHPSRDQQQHQSHHQQQHQQQKEKRRHR